MKKALLTIALCVAITPIYSYAQKAGTFVGSLGIGISNATGDFNSSDFYSAKSGFGMEGELRLYLLNGFAIGGLVNYMRFGTSISTLAGRLNYNFDQLGGTARLNLIPLSNGAIFVYGGGGTFKPTAHFYVPDNSIDITSDKRGYFGFGGIGLTSLTHERTMYELEARYNIGRADVKSKDFGLPTNLDSNAWDFFYVGVKLSFASKGNAPHPRY
jgi:hypothetical protein